MMKRFYHTLLFFLFLGQYCMAQTEAVFKLTLEHGHFYCETTLNGAKAKLMLESGVPGLMFFTMPAIFDFDENELYLCK